MLTLYEIIESLCKSRNINITEMCKESGASRGSLTDLKMGRKKSLTADTLSKIALYFGITVDYLLGNETNGTSKDAFSLMPKDERDIAKKLEATLGQLEGSQGGLMFDGEPLDDETRELLRESLKNSLEWSKRMAKKKYTPKKFHKQED